MFLVFFFFLRTRRSFIVFYLCTGFFLFLFFFPFCDPGAREEEIENFATVSQEPYPGKSTTMTSGDFQSVIAFTGILSYFVPISWLHSPPSLSTR